MSVEVSQHIPSLVRLERTIGNELGMSAILMYHVPVNPSSIIFRMGQVAVGNEPYEVFSIAIESWVVIC